MYYIINRGVRREAIFEDGEDWQRLLQTLTEACQKTCRQAEVAFAIDDAAGLDSPAGPHGQPRACSVVAAIVQ
jgi:hypothetical protein